MARYMSWYMQPEDLWTFQKVSSKAGYGPVFLPSEPSFFYQTAFPFLCDSPVPESVSLAFPCSSSALSLLPISPWDHGGRGLFPVSHSVLQLWPQVLHSRCPTYIETLWRLILSCDKKKELSVDTAFAVIGQRIFIGVLAWGNLTFRVIKENFVIKSVADKVPSGLCKTKSPHMLMWSPSYFPEYPGLLYHHWVTGLSSPATGEAP